MTKHWMILTLGCILMGCSSITVDFSFSPTQPRAGETVTFTNLSTGGADWAWSFGDGATSMFKNPSTIYRQPGRYMVTLKVDNNKSATKEITIYDTIPNFACTTEYADSLGLNIYEDVTFQALVYNPFDYPISYQWSITSGGNYTPLSDYQTEETWKLYFHQQGTYTIQLCVVLNGDTTIVLHDYTVNDVPASAVLFQTANDSCWRRRIYGSRTDMRQRVDYEEGLQILANKQDTFQNYNGHDYYLSQLRQYLPNLEGFMITSRKIYARTANLGFCIANLPDANNLVVIDPEGATAIHVDNVNNRIYWANNNGIQYMPLINSDNNHFTTLPTTLDSITQVVKLAVDPTLR